MSRIAVTGGAGRLGRSVVAHLADAGHDVVSVDIIESTDVFVEQCVADLSDPAAANKAFSGIGPDTIIHLAAIAIPFSRPDAEIFATNTSITYNVIDSAVDCGATKLLVSSSPTVIGYGNPNGWQPHALPIDETHPLEPWHGYSASKQAMEKLIAMAVRQHADRVRFGLFRPCYVIAPEEWAGAPTQQGHTVLERLDDPALSAVALFNYLDARDAGDFVLSWMAAADQIPNGTCFFVAAADSLARGPVSQLLPQYIDGVDELAAPLGDTGPVFDCSLAEQLLGWTPKRSWRTELLDESAV